MDRVMDISPFSKLNICYYPTTTIFLDDNSEFLQSLPLLLNKNIAYKLFVNTESAIDYIREIDRKSPLTSDNYVTLDEDSTTGIRLNIKNVVDKANDKSRFLEPSVLVVDYDMPIKDGLQVCLSMQDVPIKKVLFTGVADEKIAVEALNNRVIDYYIRKNSIDGFSQLNSLIPQLQNQYFLDIFGSIRSVVSTRNTFFDDSAFTTYFVKLCRSMNVVEYYFLPDQQGFLLVSGDGVLSQLLVYTQEEIKAHQTFSMDAGAPQALLEKLASLREIPYFHITDDGYYHQGIARWEKFFYPAETIEGKVTYYCAVTTPVHLTNHIRPLPYEHYLQTMAA